MFLRSQYRRLGQSLYRPTTYKRAFGLHVAKNESELNGLLDNPAKDKLTVLYWTASWCGPCRTIAPFVEEISSEYDNDVTFVKADVDHMSDAPMKHNISSVPTFQFLKNSVEEDRMVGADRDTLLERVKALK